MTGAVLLGLFDPGDGEVGERLAHPVATVTVHHVHRRLHGSRGVDHVLEHGAAREGVEHLRQLGSHPLALPRGQDREIGRFHHATIAEGRTLYALD